jgi:hypothetical protein
MMTDTPLLSGFDLGGREGRGRFAAHGLFFVYFVFLVLYFLFLFVYPSSAFPLCFWEAVGFLFLL